MGSNNSHIRKDNDLLWVTSIIVLSSFGFFSAQIVSKISHVARYAPSFTSNLTTSSSSSLGIARASSALLSLVRRLSSKINPKSKQLIFRTYLQGVTEVICVTTIEFYHIL